MLAPAADSAMIAGMRCRCFLLAAVIVAGFSLAAGAQPPPPRSQPLETVIVIANARGPAIWHATKNGADVAILGIVQPLPDDFAWNTKPLQSILDGARLVLLPPDVRMGAFSGAWFYLTEGNLLRPPDDKTLWDIVDPNVATELEKMATFLREPKDRYSGDSPIRAAMRLGSDFRHVFYLTTHEPEDSIAALARTQRVPVHRVATYDLVPSGEELLKLPPATTGACIAAAIRDIDFESRHATAAANAWAIGDVAGMMANWSPSNYYECLVELSSHATAIDARSIDDTVAAINDALANGGRSVAVVDVGLLLRKDGVVDRLKMAGVSIASPSAPVARSDTSPSASTNGHAQSP